MTRKIMATKEKVKAIRAEHLPYVRGYVFLGRKHGLGTSTVRDICTYVTHKSVR